MFDGRYVTSLKLLAKSDSTVSVAANERVSQSFISSLFCFCFKFFYENSTAALNFFSLSQ